MSISVETLALAKKNTKQVVEEAVTSVYRYRGSVETLNDLPTSGQKVGDVYNVVSENEIVKVRSQRHVRFYVSQKGVVIQKEHKTTGELSKLAGGLPVTILNSLDDTAIEFRNINYK